jgi:hypothetical protein
MVQFIYSLVAQNRKEIYPWEGGGTRGLCNLFPRVFPAEVRTRVGSEAPANPHRKPTGLSGPGSLRHQHFGNNLMPGYIITITRDLSPFLALFARGEALPAI